MNGYRVSEDASLRGRNTFRVNARAQLLIEVDDTHALPDLFELNGVRSRNLITLGEGSNVLFTEDFDGIVLSLPSRGIRVIEDRGEAAVVRVEAGENWHEFVLWSLAQGFCGLENLALIPGSVGAAPIQNIGAYGVEVCEFIHAVCAYDRNLAQMCRLENADCAFAYRDSAFKRDPGRHVISTVEFLLPRTHALHTGYAGIREELAAMNIAEPNAHAVAEAVIHLRTRKLPDPAVIGNAGSFFKNPIIARDEAIALRRSHPSLAAWNVSQNETKLSAAWLVDACGLKGLRQGDAGVSDRHALVLVNHGQASGAEIWALAQHVRDSVKQRFGVNLQPEPLVLDRRGPLEIA